MRPPDGYDTWRECVVELLALTFAMAALIGAAAVGSLHIGWPV